MSTRENPASTATKAKESAPSEPSPAPLPKAPKVPAKPREIGGPSDPEPTRYGDWERNGRCSDF
ncbi:MAG TPA: DUF1674 domain-containing protein [Stellaceae bacterium]|nr:DUF1674 domain-containing protein [Stellaceae bacterium]